MTAALSATLAIAACKKDEVVEPNVDSLRIGVGQQTINVSNNGTVTGGPITFTRPSAILAASFLNAAAAPDPVANSAAFQINITSANGGVVTFTRLSAFAGTLNGAAAGSTTLSISLFHISESHSDFGPFNVSITVN